MFSSQKSLDKRTGIEGVGRYEYLHLLIQEFHKTTSLESKLQVLANLVNFSYDPINFEYLRQLRALDLFLSQLSENNEDLLNFALAGLCNLSADPENASLILRREGVPLLEQFLQHENEEVVLNALATLTFLITPETIGHVATQSVVKKVLELKKRGNRRLGNLGGAFLGHLTDHSGERTGLTTQEILLPVE